MNGRIRNIVEAQVYGFIMGDDLKIYFFHKADCLDNDFEYMAPKMAVKFEMEKTDKGLRARQVQVIN